MHFSYKGMKNRLMLSALHFNENVWRKQAATRNRAFRYREEFPKYKKGAYIVKKVLTSHTYNYVAALKEVVIQMAKRQEKSQRREQPPTMSANYKPDKQEAIENHISRFNKRH
ncbi:hypothetical protein HHUSO_G5273 [Huso huso]|uniref:Uncharacterized protein n=1 Tax=Huso huso TaxID=61971 RepID=A0ABR1A0R1_HUSHU